MGGNTDEGDRPSPAGEGDRPIPTRRGLLRAVGGGATAGLAGCAGLLGESTPEPAEFPDDPPEAAVETVRAHVLAMGRGDYVAACRDRCLRATGNGRNRLEAERMSDGELREWARGAEGWYGEDFVVERVEIVDHSKLDPTNVAAAGYDAGYELTVEYEGEGRVANPFRRNVVDDGDWYVLVGRFGEDALVAPG